MEKTLDVNFTRMLQAVLNKAWRQHPTKQQLYSHLRPISKTTQIRRTRHVGHCWRSKDKPISNVLKWIPSHGRASVGWTARTYLQQLCTYTECRLENQRKRWTIETNGERESGKSVLAACHDDDDDIIIYIKFGYFYPIEYPNNCLHRYIYNVSTDASFFRRFMFNSGAHSELRTGSFILSTVIFCCNSGHVQVLYLLLGLNLQSLHDFT